MDVRREKRELEKERRRVHRELTREWDEQIYEPMLKKLQEECNHRDLAIVLMITGAYARVRCIACGKQVWEGNTCDIPAEYAHARVSDF